MGSQKSLWGDEFTEISPPNKTKQILDKISNPKEMKVTVAKQLKSKKLSIADRLSIIYENVERILGKHKSNIEVIKTKEQLVKFFDSAVASGIISIDTETNNSLDPHTCKLMGPCFYTPGYSKEVYVPVNHADYRTGKRLDWQLTEEDIAEQLARLSNTKIIMHHGKFDIQVVQNTTNVHLKLYWDTMIASRLLNETEPAKLKFQYISKIDSSQEEYSISNLFENVEYAWVDPDIFALYAATDAYMTYKLYEWQLKYFEDHPDTYKLYNLLVTLENPLVEVVADMELRGVELDTTYASKLSTKYEQRLIEVQNDIDKEMLKYKPIIDEWRQTSQGIEKGSKLNEPVNFNSPAQLSILLYDILKIEPVDRKKPRGTGEEILLKIAEQNNIPLCNLILEMRGIRKLIDTYVDKLPRLVNEKTGRLHGKFNQLGTDTGRFSSSEPNMQNIPSHNREIRLMFKAKDGHMFVGGDFSSQEPRLTAHYAQDDAMLKAYEEDKDLYAVIAQSIYKNRYEDNLEFYPEGSVITIDGQKIVCGNGTHQNKAGKERRNQAKGILLGLLYGRGAASIGENIGKSPAEGQVIIDKFYAAYPKVGDWMESVRNHARQTGFVEDFYGRRRRLSDILLEPYTAKKDPVFESIVSVENFNPILGCVGRDSTENLAETYLQELTGNETYRQFNDIKQRAKRNGIILTANTNRIAQAERQAVNAVVQGGAATLTKLAMLNIYRDKELNDLGFHMLITVHDELIGECPAENAQRVRERLSQVMVDTAKPYMKVPMKCDTYIVSHWYADEMTTSLHSEYKKLVAEMSEDDAFNKLCKNHTELEPDAIYNTIHNNQIIM